MIEFVSVCRLKTLIHISIYLLGLSINKTVIYHTDSVAGILYAYLLLCRSSYSGFYNNIDHLLDLERTFSGEIYYMRYIRGEVCLGLGLEGCVSVGVACFSTSYYTQ